MLWIIGALYVVCSLLRLARFNVETDEDELGFSYEIADEVLYLMFDRGLEPAEIIERGYAAEVVEGIERLERANRFKRRLMLIARLSGSAINLDREIPRD